MRKVIVVCALLVSSICAFAQDALKIDVFDGKAFYTDQIIGWIDSGAVSTVKSVQLNPVQTGNPYGNITRFKDGVFTSGNVGECGNECRVRVSGTYALEGEHIHLYLKEVEFFKECSHRPKVEVNRDLGRYTWLLNKAGVIELELVTSE